MAIKTFTMTLEWTKMLGEVRHFAFRTDDSSILNFIPGQFITIHFPWEDKTLRRSYSIATIPQQSDLIEFAAGYVENGPGSQFLFNLKPGDTVDTSGPFGRLILRDEQPKRYILVATSTGVTPYRSMLPELNRRLANQAIEVILLLGVQKRGNLLYGDEFIAFAKQHPQFKFLACYSRDYPESPEPFEHSGYVQTIFPELALDPKQDIVYLCGNPSMVDEAFAQLKTLDFDVSTVRREKYISGK